MALASISSFSILGGLHLNFGVHIQFQEGYVLKFCILLFSSCLGDLCMHIQFSNDMCTSLVTTLDENLIRGLPNMHGVFLVILTHEGVFISRGRLMRKSLVIYDPLGK